MDSETARVTAEVQKRAKLQGFRPGKAPASLIRKHFAADIRQKVLEALIPKFLQKQFEAENLNVVGTPDITDVHFHDGEPLRFKAEFEVVPEIELKDYKGVEVPYDEPEVTDEDVAKRIEELREQKAAVRQRRSPARRGWRLRRGGPRKPRRRRGDPVKTDEMVLEIGGADTLPGIHRELCAACRPAKSANSRSPIPRITARSVSPARRVKFRATLKGIRRKELPELNDEFAQDLGDYRDRRRAARGRPQEHLQGQRAARGAAGGQEQDRR